LTFTDFWKDYIESLSLLLAAVFAGLAAWFAYRLPRNVAELAADRLFHRHKVEGAIPKHLAIRV